MARTARRGVPSQDPVVPQPENTPLIRFGTRKPGPAFTETARVYGYVALCDRSSRTQRILCFVSRWVV